MKVLPMHFYSMPKIASMTVDQKDLKELLLETGGRAIVNGSLYEIISKHIGAGVYKVTLIEAVT